MSRSKVFILLTFVICVGVALLASACASVPTSPTLTTSIATTQPAPPPITPTVIPEETLAPTPTDSATALPEGAHIWTAKPVMIEMARVCPAENSPYDYLPYLILYGDGTLVKRSCEDEICTLGTAQLDTNALCRLTNAVALTGFLQTDPLAFEVPSTTGCRVRLNVQLDQTNLAEIDDLNLWIESPNWQAEILNCLTCAPAVIDPAFEDLYRLLSTYADQPLTPFETDRLAVWLTKAVILGSMPDWSPDLPSLTELAQQAACPENTAHQQQALILEGRQARAISDYINQQGGTYPVFKEGEEIWLVQTRWLLPYEMPQTCEANAGLYPPDDDLDLTWLCQAEMGAIPTPTPTITPTPTVTATPLR